MFHTAAAAAALLLAGAAPSPNGASPRDDVGISTTLPGFDQETLRNSIKEACNGYGVKCSRSGRGGKR